MPKRKQPDTFRSGITAAVVKLEGLARACREQYVVAVDNPELGADVGYWEERSKILEDAAVKVAALRRR